MILVCARFAIIKFVILRLILNSVSSHIFRTLYNQLPDVSMALKSYVLMDLLVSLCVMFKSNLLFSSRKYVTHSTLIAKIMYAAPAWWGFLSAAEKDCIELVVNKVKRYGYLPSFEHVHTLVECMESNHSLPYNPHHVLYQRLPPVKDTI